MPQYLCFGRLRDHRVHGCRRRSLRRLQRINGKETGASHHRIQDADIKRMMLRQTVHWLFFASGGWWWLALALLYLTQGLISRKIKSLSAKKQLQCPIYLGMRRKISGEKKKSKFVTILGYGAAPSYQKTRQSKFSPSVIRARLCQVQRFARDAIVRVSDSAGPQV